jgi:hypothetical protein
MFYPLFCLIPLANSSFFARLFALPFLFFLPADEGGDEGSPNVPLQPQVDRTSSPVIVIPRQERVAPTVLSALAERRGMSLTLLDTFSTKQKLPIKLLEPIW